eukprot:gnl/MRDRNA2_/MRDRNA2_61617_c0_seq1.p1 gnl/MRDRNA2_/MRDRNA2_61617_c0~~gnl/MRDRNA2_/MRDRNA2_61617_c0_seq1.p1  ORF type:complete len:815 (+),score=122.89 gnl/MRDRNA2_/MRDRNA2_61617_c0_seq1:96-2540(+)
MTKLTRRASAPVFPTAVSEDHEKPLDATAPDSSNSIFVACRVRPLIDYEIQKDATVSVAVDAANNAVKIQGGDPSHPAAVHKFTYDAVFGTDSTQEEVFEKSCQTVLQGVLNGYNGTIFCYGQTATGKTWTMEGTHVGEGRGIIPRAFESLYSHMANMPDYINCQVHASMVEIYLERICDLLVEDRDPEDVTSLPVVEHPVRGLCVQGASEPHISSITELQDLFLRGTQNRMVGCTKMNEKSSRSHSIFQVHIQATNTLTNSSINASLNLVDLAGSEKIKRTQASGLTLDEAKKINLSLYTLGTVINCLSSGKKGHVPYRDSKLTRMLQESLGGNANTAFIVTVSPSKLNRQETLTTLRFGKRAKSVKNAPEANRDMSMQELQLELKKRDKEIIRLNALLAQQVIEDQAIASRSTKCSGPCNSSSFFSSDSESDSTSVCTKAQCSAENYRGNSTSIDASFSEIPACLGKSDSQGSLHLLDQSESVYLNKALQLKALMPCLQNLQDVLDLEVLNANPQVIGAVKSVQNILEPICNESDPYLGEPRPEVQVSDVHHCTHDDNDTCTYDDNDTCSIAEPQTISSSQSLPVSPLDNLDVGSMLDTLEKFQHQLRKLNPSKERQERSWKERRPSLQVEDFSELVESPSRISLSAEEMQESESTSTLYMSAEEDASSVEDGLAEMGVPCGSQNMALHAADLSTDACALSKTLPSAVDSVPDVCNVADSCLHDFCVEAVPGAPCGNNESGDEYVWSSQGLRTKSHSGANIFHLLEETEAGVAARAQMRNLGSKAKAMFFGIATNATRMLTSQKVGYTDRKH